MRLARGESSDRKNLLATVILVAPASPIVAALMAVIAAAVLPVTAPVFTPAS